MNLKKILVGIEGIKAKGEIDREIVSIENDSRKVQKGSMFFAIKGFSVDGTTFIPNAIENGADVILVEEGSCNLKSLNIPDNVTLLVVPDARYAMAISACNFYDNPSKKLKLIGKDIDNKSHRQIEIGNGYDHVFLLNENKKIYMEDKISKRNMTIKTNQECVVIYTMNYEHEKTSYTGKVPPIRHGICFETQRPPIGRNMCYLEESLLKKGEQYEQKTEYIFNLVK